MWNSRSWPERLGRYEVKGIIGKGSMGTVFLAYDPLIGREVAVKLMTFTMSMNSYQRKKYMERFLSEARAGGRILHPKIVQIFDVGFYEGVPFIVMECVRGRTLYDHVKDRGVLSPEEVVDVGVQVCEALEAAHKAGVFHRDIKPTNILITREGIVKIVDLSVAKMEDVSITETGETWGSPAYMSPEQLRGEKIDQRTDIFSLGATLYFALTGKKPFHGDTIAEVVEKILHWEPPPPSHLRPDVPSVLSDVIMRCLRKERGERFSSAESLKEALLKSTQRTAVRGVVDSLDASEHLEGISTSYRIFLEKTSSLRKAQKSTRHTKGFFRRIVEYFFS